MSQVNKRMHEQDGKSTYYTLTFCSILPSSFVGSFFPKMENKFGYMSTDLKSTIWP